ncbi:hypothetical protein KKG16_01345, partial [Patescibacteria group bacterium]|nr:hypothetical protein [Patescibacteria group bacterium]
LSPRERGWGRGATSGEGLGERGYFGRGAGGEGRQGRRGKTREEREHPFIMIHQIIKSTQYQILNI